MKAIFLVLFILCFAAGFAMERVTYDEILKYEDWSEIYECFPVDAAFVDLIRSQLEENLKIDVYFAYWCVDSVHNVPPFIKILDLIGYEKIEVDYYNVGKRKKGTQKYYVDDLQIERIPTFIFSKNGGETGRIIENPKITLVEDFLNIILTGDLKHVP